MEASSDHPGERGVLSSLDKGGGRAGAGAAGNLRRKVHPVESCEVRGAPTPRAVYPLPTWEVLAHPGFLPSEDEKPCLVSFPASVLTPCSSVAGAKRVFNAAHTVLLGAF